MSPVGGAGAFVIGSGRCGSTLLSNMLRLHPEVLSLSEWFTVLGPQESLGPEELSSDALVALLTAVRPDLSAHLRAAPVPEILWRPAPEDEGQWRRISPLLLAPLPHLVADPQALLGPLLRQAASHGSGATGVQFERLFGWLLRDQQRRLWIERSGGSLEYADRLLHHFPRARYVLLLRDGVDTALSMASHPFFHVRLARILARDPHLPVAACLERPVPLHRFGAYWSALMVNAKRFARVAGAAQLLLLRYEELMAEPAGQLRRLSSFLQLSADDRWQADAGALVRPAGARGSPPGAELDALQRACRPGSRALQDLAATAAGQ